jgi:peptidoglycan/LPS O-acetylase OafA/YrhL
VPLRQAGPLVGLTLLFLGAGERSAVMPALLLVSLWLMCGPAHTPGALRRALARLFAHRSSSLLAELSYSVYIVHLIFMLPLFAVVARHTSGSTPAWLVATAGLLALVAVVSWAMYRWIELPGIAWGKRLQVRPLPAPREVLARKAG